MFGPAIPVLCGFTKRADLYPKRWEWRRLCNRLLNINFYGYSARWTRLVGKILAGLFSGALLAITIVLLVMFEVNIAYLNLEASVIMKLSVGSVVMPLAVLIACALPAGRRTVIYVSESPVEFTVRNDANEAIEEQLQENAEDSTENPSVNEYEQTDLAEMAEQMHANSQTIEETVQ